MTFGLLVFATLLCQALNFAKPQNKTLLNVRVILRSWWVIVTILSMTLLVGKYGLLVLFFILSLLIMNEYLKKSRYGSDHRVLVFTVIGLILIIQYLAIVKNWDQLFSILVPIMALFAMPVIVIATGSIVNLPTAFASIVGLMLLNFYLSFIPAIAFSNKIIWNYGDQPMMSILLLLFFTETNDIFQFLCGKLFGRRKIVPLISPNKTEMGFLGGMICTTLAVTFAGSYVLNISIASASLMGITLSIFGILGDLFFSVTKRNLEIKDFSQALPGHGGVIDRLDSLIFTAPIYFQLLIYLKGKI